MGFSRRVKQLMVLHTRCADVRPAPSQRCLCQASEWVHSSGRGCSLGLLLRCICLSMLSRLSWHKKDTISVCIAECIDVQDVFATPGSSGSAQAGSASKSGTASRRAAPPPAAGEDGERRRSSGRKRGAPLDGETGPGAASSGARAKRSRLAPVDTEAEAAQAPADGTPVPAPGSPAAHTRSHDQVRLPELLVMADNTERQPLGCIQPVARRLVTWLRQLQDMWRKPAIILRTRM